MIDEKISSISRDLVFLANDDGVTRILEETFCVDWRGDIKMKKPFFSYFWRLFLEELY
jgi:hypothetical protein